MDFKISTEAENDLTKTWSIAQANRYINLIFQEIDFICKNPMLGLDFSYVKDGYFKTKVKPHFIFYKINYQKSQIEIIRILNQRMIIEERLK